MQIQLISTSVETKPTARGSYQQLEVVYKNLTFQGKIESKKLMSFGAGANAFTTLSTAAAGSIYEVTVVKNDKGYNDWTAVVTSNGAAAATPSNAPPIPAKTAVGATRSTYETPEERAQRQILIVRQSSLSAAVATLAVGAKSVKPEEVVKVAQQYTDFVFEVKDPGESGFEDIPDFDVPEVD